MPKLITSTFDPVRTDPTLFVDREAIFEDLSQVVMELVSAQRFQGRIAVVGPKGVGKTMLTRAVLARVRRDCVSPLITVEVDGRGLGYRPFLKKVARLLAEETKRHVGNDEVGKRLQRYSEELGLLAMQDSISEADTQSIARNYGASAGLEGGIFGVLTGRALFRWSETRQTGEGTTRTREVSNDLLHTAIQVLLEELRKTGLSVVIFFNDLDQAVPRENPSGLREALGRLVALEPCIQLLNLRSEVLYDDLHREADVHDVPPMEAEALMQLFEARRRNEPNEAKRAQLESPEMRKLAEQLAQVNGNPYAFLTWVHAALREYDFPPPPLHEPRVRAAIVARARALPDQDLLRRAASIVDACSSSVDSWCSREELRQGRTSLQPSGGPGLQDREVDNLVQAGVLVPRDIFLPDRGLRLEPTLDLLKPSVTRHLRT